MSTLPRVAIVLVNWNGWRHCVECLDSLLAQSYPNYHVFVVDNDSQDESVPRMVEWCAAPRAEPDWCSHADVKRVTGAGTAGAIACRLIDRPDQALPPAPPGTQLTLIRSGGNRGFAGGCNVGIRAAGLEAFELFWLLNTDTVVHHDALAALVSRVSADETIGMVGSTIRYYDSPEKVQCLGGARLDMATMTSLLIGEGSSIQAVPVDGKSVETQMTYVMGASMLVSRKFVKDVGLLQEDYFLYYEEIDWAVRGRSRFKLGYAPASHVLHRSGATSSQVMPAFTSNLYYRNRLRFVSRFFPERLAAAKRGLAIDLMRHTLKGRWTHARIVAAALWDAPKLAVQAHIGGA